MATWVGFSDEELRRMKPQNDSNQNARSQQMGMRAARGRPAASASRGRGPQIQRRQQSVETLTNNMLPPEARLSQTPSPDALNPKKPLTQIVAPRPQKPTQDAVQVSPKPAVAQEKPPKRCNTQPQTENDMRMESQTEASKESQDKKAEDDNMGMVLDDKDIIIQELHNVEKFQFQQKRIEEQNKKKRELLATAIQERQKKAKQEATRLIKIQKELAQLDHLLAIDVSIIRNKIEDASREYLEAQRRYERAEKEFIESKMDLHNKVDHKDSLTEHLHMVIHQNEVRKARKLTELMEKLSMEEGNESEQLTEELSATAPSAFILGSLQSTQEQRTMMHRKRNTSESSGTPLGGASPQSAAVKRSTSEGSSSESPSKAGMGVTGWISSWIMGGGGAVAESKAKGEAESSSHSRSFQTQLAASGENAGVVTQAPAANAPTAKPVQPAAQNTPNTIQQASLTVSAMTSGKVKDAASPAQTNTKDNNPAAPTSPNTTVESPSSESGIIKTATETNLQNTETNQPPQESPQTEQSKAEPSLSQTTHKDDKTGDENSKSKDFNDNKVKSETKETVIQS